MNKKHYIAVGVAAVLGFFVWLLWPQSAPSVVDIPMSPRQERPDMRLSFAYPEGGQLRVMEGGLPIGDLIMTGTFVIGSTSEAAPTISAFTFGEPDVLVDEGELAAGVATTTVGEQGTSTKMTKAEALRAWLTSASNITKYNQAYNEEVVTVDGVEAIRYLAPGTSLTYEIYAALFKGEHYLFVGQFENPGDIYQRQFAAFMESIYFE